MATGINKVILVGHLGKDPIIQEVGNGIKKATFSLATTESILSKEGIRTEHTEWHNIIVWRGLADVTEKYLRKGNMVYIEGRIRNSQYTDKEGIKRNYTDIQCDNLVLMSNNKQSGPAPIVTTQQGQFGTQPINQNDPVQENNMNYSNEGSNDDLPF